MGAVPITIIGTITGKSAKGESGSAVEQVMITGIATITGLEVGGGPMPGGGGGGGQPPGINYPQFPSNPIAEPPWGWGNRPPEFPEPPPEGSKPPPPDGGWGYSPEYGWGYFPSEGQSGPKRGKL